MTYEISAERRKNYLFVRLSGKLTETSEQDSDREIVRLCNEHGLMSVLVDVRQLRGELSDGEIFRAASTLDERGFSDLRRIALLDLPADAPLNRFYETVAVNRGVSLRVFTDPDEADAWLRS